MNFRFQRSFSTLVTSLTKSPQSPKKRQRSHSVSQLPSKFNNPWFWTFLNYEFTVIWFFWHTNLWIEILDFFSWTFSWFLISWLTFRLELECITEEDAGFYQCVASQGDKVDTVGTEVHVVSKFNISLKSF